MRDTEVWMTIKLQRIFSAKFGCLFTSDSMFLKNIINFVIKINTRDIYEWANSRKPLIPS